MYDLVTLQPTLDVYHNASVYMCGGEVLPGPTTAPRISQPQPSAATKYLNPTGAHPIVLQANFTAYITDQLLSWGNPEFQVTNSDLELLVSVLHHTCMANCFDIRKRTMLSHTYNTAGLW